AVTGALGQALRNGMFMPPVDSTLDPLTYLTSQHFSPFVGSSVAGTSSSGRRGAFRLVEVNDTLIEANEKRGYTGQSYSLILESPSRVPGEVYEFRHKLLGTFALFVSPVGKRGNRYQAVVNRIAVPDQA
ncbi:MAG TPA: hypothetical protein VL501_08530, partial [Pyrinomonadaceae bacterium]|nr:hypothetical protein [Pyrinomonadaceae bacterium]